MRQRRDFDRSDCSYATIFEPLYEIRISPAVGVSGVSVYKYPNEQLPSGPIFVSYFPSLFFFLTSSSPHDLDRLECYYTLTGRPFQNKYRPLFTTQATSLKHQYPSHSMDGVTNIDEGPKGSWKSRNCLSLGEYLGSWSFNGTWLTVARRFCMWAIIILRTVTNILAMAHNTLGSKIVSMICGVIIGIISFAFVFWCLTIIDRARGNRACWFCGLVVVGLPQKGRRF